MPDRVHSQQRYKKKSNNNIQKRNRRAKDENRANVEHDGTKSKKMKFCRVLEAGYTPYVGYRKIKIA